MKARSVGAVINVCLLFFFVALFVGVFPSESGATNTLRFSDIITDSRPLGVSNHTFTFTLNTDVDAGAVFTFDFPAEFLLPATTTFAERNVEMRVNGVTRNSGAIVIPGRDGVTINTGYGGSIEYEFAPATPAPVSGDVITLLVGNHTTDSLQDSFAFSTSTGTTTIPGDPEPIVNASTSGTYIIELDSTGNTELISADFNIAIVQPVGIGPADTTEEIPPFRFNGAPEGQIGGTTLSVEISLETDEFAICKWTTASGTPFIVNTNIMDNTGLVQHSTVVVVTPNALNTFYIRCIDDEGNFNTDDFLIQFIAPEAPSGIPNADGDVEGDGTGDGNDGSGDGDGGGGSTGESDGDQNTTGGSSGGGGSGGGGGGSRGEDDEDDAGGGFESTDGPYRSGEGRVFINGFAFPGSTVYAIVDGFIADTERAGADGRYSLTVDEIARGVYTFGVYAIDERDVQSSVFSTSFTVTGARTTSLSNINVMPSILVEPDPVDVGAPLTISGYAIPNANITIENMKDRLTISERIFNTTSDENGLWSIDVDTDGFDAGTYKVRARSEAIDGSVETDFSDYTFYGVGQEAEGQINADLNRDGSVNLTDFSILLFWWGGDGGNSDPPADINRNGSVDLTDFSILLFNWTG